MIILFCYRKSNIKNLFSRKNKQQWQRKADIKQMYQPLPHDRKTFLQINMPKIQASLFLHMSVLFQGPMDALKKIKVIGGLIFSLYH